MSSRRPGRWADAARDGGALATVSRERIAGELRLLAAEPDPVAAFATLRELGLDAALASGYGISDRRGCAGRSTLLPGRPTATSWCSALAAEGAAADAVLLGPEEGVVAAVAHAADDLAPALAAAGGPAEIAAAAAGAPAEAVAAAGATELRARRTRHGSGWRSCAGCGSRSAARICWPPACRPDRRWAPGLRAALAARLDGRVQRPRG